MLNNNRPVRRLVVSLAALSLVSVTACSSASAGGGSAAAATGLPSTVTIGGLTSLSGSSAGSCVPEADGMRLATEVAQSQHLLGNSKISITIDDDQSTATGGVTEFTKLVGQGYAGIVGPCLSNVAQAVVPLIDRYKVPVVITTAAAPQYVAPKYAFRGEIPQTTYDKATVDYLVSQHVKTVAAVVNTTNPTVVELWTDIFKPELGKLGIKVVYDAEVSSDVVDFTSEVARIQESHPDAIINLENGPNAIPLQKQLRAAGLNQLVAGQLSFDSSDFRTLPQAANSIYTVNYSTVFTAKSSIAFTEAFEKKYGHAPSGIAAGAYDATMRLIKAIAAAKSVNHAAVQAALAAQKSDAGAQGTLTYTPDGDVTGAGGVVEILAGGKEKLLSGGN